MDKQRLTRSLIQLAAGLIVSLALASSAAATSVDVYGNPMDWGFDLSGLSGVASLLDQGVGSFLTTNTNDITISTPASISGENNPTGGFANPSNGASVWTVTANDRNYEDAWLVIVGHAIAGPEADPHGPAGDLHYVTANVGLAVDDADPLLRIVSPVGLSYTYLALFLGNLTQNVGKDVSIDYRVAQALFPVGSGEFMFPKYQVAYLENISVPEPGLSLLGMMSATVMMVWARRRRRQL